MTNKHLLPVGRWPMVYYPLLGSCSASACHGGAARHRQAVMRATSSICSATAASWRAPPDEPLLPSLDLTYKVQVEPGGIAQVVGMARDFARGEKLVVCLGDNIFENAQADSIAGWGDGAMVFVREVDDPVSFGVVAYDDDGRVADIVEEGRRRRHALRRRRRRATRWSGLCTATRPTSSRSSTRSAPSIQGRLEITDVNTARLRRARGELSVCRVEGWWHDGGKHSGRPRRRGPRAIADRPGSTR